MKLYNMHVHVLLDLIINFSGSFLISYEKMTTG